ncbi:hypothetical protein SAMN05720766_101340 [Fibrobacter sp. UWH9]|uniref:hypothetical protein n=1 Tax=unclassified Fibrobacter TaxID=2634177 RepID=UPI000914684A|nr:MULTISPECIES: hypothetical protein [unclassified Fibrobacter]SHG37859.1 hypothetical protein SAMN05720766_101340 [Fibrobacter sp. UWH9]SHK17625.1 hypothetical protein SAMN05720765_101121 [Fibrobacter sp. UWH6]
MQLFKSHISAMWALLLLLICSTAAFAENVDCVNYNKNDPKATPDVRCKYARIWSTRTAVLYVVDPDSAIMRKNAIPYKDFLVYIPKEVSTDTLTVTKASDSTQIKNLTPVNSGADSVVEVNIYGHYAYENFQLGTAVSESDIDPIVSLVYNFYAPELEYSIDGKVITDVSKLDYKVGDTVKVDVRAVIPYGPQADRTDSTLERTFFFSAFGDSKSLKFLSPSGSDLTLSDGSVRLKIENGKSSFLVVATKAVTDGSTFTLGGFDDGKDSSGKTKFLVDEKFPGELQFKNPDMPSLDGAAIYDTDGDGIGDSIATWFSGNMDSVSVDSFYYSWPDDESFKKYSGDVKENKNGDIFGLPDVSVKLQKDSATGAVKAYVCSTLGNRCDTLKTDLKDSIGAAIQSASLIKGNGKTDTLVVRFNKDMDESWTSGRGLVLNGEAIDVNAVKKDGNVWTFVVKTGVVEVGDMIKIETVCGKDKCPDGILTSADGVPTSKNNKEVPVDNAGRVYADNENNGFYDRDGDGRMDSVSLGFSTPITEDDLKNLELKFYWLDKDGDVVEIVPTSIYDLVISDDGLVVGYALDPDKYNIKPMLTSIDSVSSKGKEYGYAKLINKVTIDGEKTEEETLCGMHDYMPPVISTTFLNPESFQEMEPDRFTVTFSEPIDYKNFNLTDDCLAFYVDGEWVHYDLSDAQWSNGGRTVTFMMEAGADLTSRMNPADSVRFDNFTSGLKDLEGNNVAEVTPPVMVKGDPRVVMKTTSMADLNRMEELSERAKPFTLDHVESELSEEQKASLGVLMDVSFATIMKNGSDGVSKVDIDKIGLKWELYVYTNLGAYVGHASGKIDCDDPFFDGNCLENPDKLYVRWNMRSDNGRKVGVGIYLAKFNIRVYGAEEDFKVERVFRWGVSATKH